MNLKIFIISAFTIIRNVFSFTNGTLLPSYLCGPQGDGYPKSVGTLIPFLQLGNLGTPYNQFPPGNGTIPILINDGINNQLGNALAPNAQQIIGSFHNGNPNTGYTTATKNPVLIVPTDFTDFNTGNINPYFVILPDTDYNMSIVVNSPIFNDPNVALDGAFVYALDAGTGLRIGSFTFTGNNMSPWYACSLGNLYPFNTGIVHNQLLSETPIYSNIIWRSPRYFIGNVTFIGAGVTDAGYGPFSVTYQT
jgi:hypothetical protein